MGRAPDNLSAGNLPDKKPPTLSTSIIRSSWAQTSADWDVTQVTMLRTREDAEPGPERTHFLCRNKDQKNWSFFQVEPDLYDTSKAEGKERERENPNESIWA